MKKEGRTKKVLLVILIVAVFLAVVYNFTKPDVIELDGVEVEEYDGERLDSINDFLNRLLILK